MTNKNSKINLPDKKSQPRLRLVVNKTLKNISCQIIDDSKGQTLVSSSSLNFKNKSLKILRKDFPEAVGKDIAQKAKLKKISKVYFDRNKHKYQGQVKKLAQAARTAGLEF